MEDAGPVVRNGNRKGIWLNAKSCTFSKKTQG